MILSMTFQFRLFFMAAAMGIAGGLAYTLMCTACTMICKSRSVKNILDMVFWILYSLVFFLSMLYVNYGEIRPFSIMGIALGMLIYYMIMENTARRAAEFIFGILHKILLLITEIILTPFKLFLFPAKKLLLIIKKACKNAKSMRE